VDLYLLANKKSPSRSCGLSVRTSSALLHTLTMHLLTNRKPRKRFKLQRTMAAKRFDLRMATAMGSGITKATLG
jgi:hypothetical protein